MSRRRRKAVRKSPPPNAKPPSVAETGPSTTENRSEPNPPRPNKWFLATAMFLEVTWISALVLLALTK